MAYRFVMLKLRVGLGGFCVELHYGTVRGTLSFFLRLHRKVGQNSSLKTVP